MADADLATALKQAKTKLMFFAFIGKGTDGKLIVSKVKVPAKQIADAKKEIGGNTVLSGKCMGGEQGSMVFQVAKEAPATMVATIKKVVKRDAGIAIVPVFQVTGDAENEGDGSVANAANPSANPGQLDLSLWTAARQKAMTDLKGLAAKVAATRHGSAAGVIKEIQSIIGKLPATPTDLAKLENFVRTDDAITAAEEVPDHFHTLDIRQPLLAAIASMN